MDKFDQDVHKRLERKRMMNDVLEDLSDEEKEQWFYGMISYDLENPGYIPSEEEYKEKVSD